MEILSSSLLGTGDFPLAKKQKLAAIRPGGRRFEVYNEALCVYLYDESHTETLRKLIDNKGNPHETFYDNLSTPAFAKAVAAKHLALAYELQQDDEVFVEVIVGPPLTDNELAVARWLPVQRSQLSLPSGRMRIDSPNTMPLDEEDPEDNGAVCEVPADDYVFNLYRVDWTDCERDGIKYKGPGEVIVLSPFTDAETIEDGPVILEFPEAVEDESWIGQYSIDKTRFDCQVNFWDYWEFLWINLEHDAAAALGLTCGSILRLRVDKMTFDLVYLDDVARDDYLSRVGKSAFDATMADRPEIALGGWMEKGGRQILGFYRTKAVKSVPAKYHEIWTPASGEVLAESLPLPAEVKLPEARVQGNTVRAAVALANSDLLVVKVTQKQLAGFGNTIKLALPHGTHTIALGDPDRTLHTVFLTGKGIPTGLHILKAMGLRAFALEGKVPKKGEDYIEVLPKTERQPVNGLFPPATNDPLSKYLHLRPMHIDGMAGRFDWTKPPAIGTEVTLTQ